MTPEAEELYREYLELNKDKDESKIVLATRAVVKSFEKDGQHIELRRAIAIARKFLDNNDQ